MAVKVWISATLKSFTNHRSEIELEGETAGEVIQALADEYPEIQKALFDEEGKLRAFVNIFVGEKNIRDLNGYDTPLKCGDEVMLVPTIAGGKPEDSVIDADRKEKLDNNEISRYSHHLLLKEIGVKGQKRLKAAKVLIVGLGGLGAPLAQYLAAAGVGTIGLIDCDEVETANLQDQVIHGTRDVGRPKVMSARDSIRAINPLVKVETHHELLTAENALDIIRDYDVVADATDNYKSRYLINDACVLLGKPDVFGAMYKLEGQMSVYYAKEGPCYRCLYQSPPPMGLVPSCAESGVVSALPGIIGTIQANEVIKLIVGGGEPLIGRLLTFDAWKMKFRELKIRKNPECPICGNHPIIRELEEYDYEELCGQKEQEEEEPVESIEAAVLKERLDRGDEITIIDVREPHERAIVKFPGAKIIPIGQLARRKNELNPEIDTVFICKEGKRSILAISTLLEAGYQGKMYNLKDGINTWAKEVDQSMPQY